jgi:hypothetical protein
VSLNPNGAPFRYSYQAGATAYLIDPAGTYSLAGAPAPTIDPGGGDGDPETSPPTLAAGVYIPAARAISSPAETFDSVNASGSADASATATDLAGS